MTFASTSVSPRLVGSTDTNMRTGHPTLDGATNRLVWPWYIHMCLCTGGLLVCWFAMLLSLSIVPTSTARLVLPCCTAVIVILGGIAVYAFLAWLLMRVPVTSEFGFKLWNRLFHHPAALSPLHSFDNDRILRTFVEMCTWVAIVLGTYAIYRRPLVAVLVGGISGIWVVAIGDFFVVYIRVQSEFQRRQRPQPLGDDDGKAMSPWRLQYAVMTVSLGYVVLGLVRLVFNLVWSAASDSSEATGEGSNLLSLHIDTGDQQLIAWQYMLSVLMGVSLIVTSELLMLYEPTREAGMVLQARIVNAKANWLTNPVRSVVEVAFVCGVTAVLNHYVDNMTLSLQIGTVMCTGFILCGEYAVYSRARASPTLRPPYNDHWMKVLPLLSLAAFMVYQIGRLFLQRHHDILTAFVVPSLLDLMVVAAVSKSVRLDDVWARLRSFCLNATRHPARTTLEAMAHASFLAAMMGQPNSDQLPRWTKVVATLAFDIGLVYMQRLGPSVWDAIDAVRYASSWRMDVEVVVPRATSSRPELAPNSTLLIWAVPEDDVLEADPSMFAGSPGNLRNREICHIVHVSTLINFSVMVCVSVAGCWYGFDLFHRVAGIASTMAISIFVSCCAGVVVGLFTSSSHATFRLLRRVVVLSINQQCVLHPVQVFVEGAVCLGVLAGTYTISGTWTTSVLLATASVVVVVGGTRWVAHRWWWQRFVPTTASTSLPTDQATFAVVYFMALLSTYALGMSLFFIYNFIDRIEVAFCLATLSGVVFVAASELCIMWGPTRAAGIVLQTRVTHCVQNWQVEPLRSFLECLVWISVTYGTFVLYHDVVVALHLGTLSGIVVTLAGEVFRSQWHLHPSHPQISQDGNVHQRPKVLPLLLLFAYVGAGTFQWIFEHLRRLEVTVALATVAGIVFLCVADVLAMWRPTRWAGVILQDRFLNASEHWQMFPVRSFVESGCFLGVIYGSHAIYGDLTVAVQCGTLSGMLVTLIGEQLKSHRRTMLSAPPTGDKQILPFPIISVLGFVGCVAFNTIYTHLRNIEMAFVLATTSGVVFVVLGDVFVFWAPTRYVGLVLQERVLHVPRDLRQCSWRGWWELTACTVALSASYCYLWQGDLLVAIQLGTFTAIVVCVVNDRILNSISQYEQAMVHQGQWHAQDQSKLLAMPCPHDLPQDQHAVACRVEAILAPCDAPTPIWLGQVDAVAQYASIAYRGRMDSGRPQALCSEGAVHGSIVQAGAQPGAQVGVSECRLDSRAKPTRSRLPDCRARRA
ncbi:hypothetical protein, variant 1 [Aphanomyces invadans]|uniref:Uncharacterized protein n=1 Tax=Aphanomyces invadans TaxID=157072 RepID=A0A024U6B8_9STRA|nr:hypothetical protein, variant 1 [Aphanomyces invadans]ETW01946.1 hypothetical protein, variant 1 [Aphanomyces invadans]|eukprot:XP_008869794.1 hypothetical protein, variant 1 [Aphanomyces invadans]